MACLRLPLYDNPPGSQGRPGVLDTAAWANVYFGFERPFDSVLLKDPNFAGLLSNASFAGLPADANFAAMMKEAGFAALLQGSNFASLMREANAENK